MKSLIAPVVAVALALASCGKSELLPNGAGGAAGVGHGGAAGAAGSASAAGTTGASGAAGAAASTSGAAGAAAGASGGATGTGGTGAAAGTTGTDGGADAAPACTTGATRCDGSGHRLRCAADGSWADDNYVCTVALSGSSDYSTMCAIKADGRLACWAAGDWFNGQAAMMAARAPAGAWRQISVGDDGDSMCAIATSGTVSCWGTSSVVTPVPSGTFEAFSFSIYASCAITSAGTPTCFNSLPLPSDFTGQFKQIVTANQLVYGIDENDALHAPSFVLPSYPVAKYKQIIANNDASCALRDDGAIFCYPVAGDALPPPTEGGFVEVASTYGNWQACAIRGDGTVSCWLGDSTMQPLDGTPDGTFTHLAGCENAMCGIRTDGTTVCWQIAGMDPLVPPAGW